jgi:MYXO-CTERM domain-containing protein
MKAFFMSIPAERTGLRRLNPASARPFRAGGTTRPVLMKLIVRLSVSAALLGASFTASAQYASSVIRYDLGTGGAAGYTDSATVLGQPSRNNPFGPVDPFNSQYAKTDLLSIGAGGFLVVKMDHAVGNDPGHPFGLDFLVFGNAGFNIVNGDYSGGGITDGSLYGANTGSTRVSVSADGVQFFTLNTSIAPIVDAYFPTDGAGDFTKPVDPSLTPASFNNLGLAGIGLAYGGSAGGTGYDLAWAVDGNGASVVVPPIEYIRIDVLSGKAEIDGISAVSAVTPVPEPSSMALGALGLGAVALLRRRKA